MAAIIKHTDLDKLDDEIDVAVSQLTPLQSYLENLAGVLAVGGMLESIRDSFRQIFDETNNLQGQILLMQDELESDHTCQIMHLDNGEFVVVAPEDN